MLKDIGALTIPLDDAALIPDNTCDKPSTHVFVVSSYSPAASLALSRSCALASFRVSWLAIISRGSQSSGWVFFAVYNVL